MRRGRAVLGQYENCNTFPQFHSIKLQLMNFENCSTRLACSWKHVSPFHMWENTYLKCSTSPIWICIYCIVRKTPHIYVSVLLILRERTHTHSSNAFQGMGQNMTGDKYLNMSSENQEQLRQLVELLPCEEETSKIRMQAWEHLNAPKQNSVCQMCSWLLHFESLHGSLFQIKHWFTFLYFVINLH